MTPGPASSPSSAATSPKRPLARPAGHTGCAKGVAVSSDEPRWTPTQPAPGSLEALQAEVASLRAEVDRLRAGQRDRADAAFERIVRPPRHWRRRLGALLLVLACAFAPLAVFSIWLHGQVSDTGRYVQTVAPLSENHAIDAAVAAKVTAELFARVDAQALARQALPEHAQCAAGPRAVRSREEIAQPFMLSKRWRPVMVIGAVCMVVGGRLHPAFDMSRPTFDALCAQSPTSWSSG